MSDIRIQLAAVGDANDIATWSGIPYHLLQEGLRQRAITAGLALTTSGAGWTLKRCLWNLQSMARGDRLGGYQYSISFLEALWSRVADQVADARLLNCFQLYPPSVLERHGDRLWFYIDQTLPQLFGAYGIRERIGRRVAEDALHRERAGYLACAGVIVHSRWAANSVINDHGIDKSKVFCIAPGANLDDALYREWAKTYRFKDPRHHATLRLVFVGKEPRRKGLDRLLRALRFARSRGANCTLRVIGCLPEAVDDDLRSVPGVEWFGFIDKRGDTGRYLQVLSECDVGCLLSRAEAGGISLREFHACGLAVIGPDVGGSPDHVIDESAILVDHAATDEQVADILMQLDSDRDRVAKMKQVSFERRHDMTWEPVIRRIAELLNGAETTTTKVSKSN